MKKIRNLHLWIGLFTSLLILIEAVTGLLMVEPWLMGAGKPAAEQRVMLEGQAPGGAAAKGGAPAEGVQAGKQFNPNGQGSSITAFVKNLHAGRIGGADVSILLDMAALGLIIMTVTGMVLTVKALKRQRAKPVR
ncbi:PepSY-associated TM helix domain-containing protein [Pelotomaculum propionicicum]|uniref:PepSY domain-containing protein n=1 Tax=Pelotomaculum propionicicum TaxID=258475 RepID=A0A4Y7RYC0_9FIRM|nr:PepSY-associated TM helix domain-containing protein [Pelotomaculum propionicicum]NLI13569.1 PepSY domain-containing protein [Peptococcaceae bacterium]TEB13750.1 hypothetical protein Pmgp_00158 [Pelotomaculum propionicicum]